MKICYYRQIRMHTCEVMKIFKVLIAIGSHLLEMLLNSAVSIPPSILTCGLCEGNTSPPFLVVKDHRPHRKAK